MNRPEYDIVVKMLRQKQRLRTIKEAVRCQPKTIRYLANTYVPEWVEWAEALIIHEYETIGRKQTKREWSMSDASMNALLKRHGVQRKSEKWTGEHRKANIDHDVPHPLMTRAISMKWVAA